MDQPEHYMPSRVTRSAGGSLRVPWRELDHKKFEELVSAMLSREHPRSRRIDGSGGDQGCDVAFPTERGLEVFELKSMTGRLTKSRRAQIERSLRRAADLHPVEWHLVLPIDLTMSEQSWFDNMTSTFAFPCDWRGLNWLDSRMADHPSLVRYFCGTGAEDLLEALAELKGEQIALTGKDVQAALDRLRILAVRIDDLNPFHTLRVTVEAGMVSVVPVPRYPGAEVDSPLVITATFSFPDTDEGRGAEKQFRRFLDYGDRVELPSAFVERFDYSWLPSGSDQSQLFQLILDGESEWVQSAALLVLADAHDEASIIGSLPIEFVRSRGGELGRTATAVDASGALTVTLTLDQGSGWTTINLAFDATGTMPSASRPARQILQEIAGARAITIRLKDGVTVPPIAVAEDAERFATIGDLIEDLDGLQRRSGIFFAVPPGLTAEDHADIRDANDLLDGKTLEERWERFSLAGIAERIPELLAAMERPGRFVAMSASDLVLGEHHIPLGVICHTYNGAVPEDPRGCADRAALADPDAAIDVVLVPAGDGVKLVHRIASTMDEIDAAQS